MTTSEQAALLAKHRADEPDKVGWPPSCVVCGQYMACDVHLMAELKDAEIAQAVSEAVERIVSALDDELSSETPRSSGERQGFRDAIALLRSRDWSKGEDE